MVSLARLLEMLLAECTLAPQAAALAIRAVVLPISTPIPICGLSMSIKPDLVIMQFFSDMNHASLNTKKALGEFVDRGAHQLNLQVKAVDYDNQKEVCHRYGVYGVPVTLILINDEIIGRHYGERTPEEFEVMLKKHMVHK